ncbi:hypothetical protein [Trinickia fusca]|uniref:Uncharacterized protein n=1 Tax=Trinickia fusca TaxID=2419777 RepID=A0A494XF47_9BURK|nr:hypothetical protein [Trinickia fusca]RKP49128.1 hypothetical protein D7S89_10025 [Trinickia fusca]
MTDSASRERALEQTVFDEWPTELRALFDGTSLETKAGFTASLILCEANGHLRTSLLGVGELYAPDARTLAFALWPSSRAARALREQAARGRAQAGLTFVYEAAFYQVQLDVRPLSDADGERGAQDALACFVASIETGEAQQVRYARLNSGITFELGATKPAVLERWGQQVGRLRQALLGAR